MPTAPRHGPTVTILFVLLGLTIGSASGFHAHAQDSQRRLGVYIGLSPSFNQQSQRESFRRLASLLSEQLAGELRHSESLNDVFSIHHADLGLDDEEPIDILDLDIELFISNQNVEAHLSNLTPTHLLLGVIEPANPQYQAINFKLVELDYSSGRQSLSKIHEHKVSVLQEALHEKNVSLAAHDAIAYLINRDNQIWRTNKVFATCFNWMGDEDMSLLNHILQLPLEVSLKISSTTTQLGLEDRGYDVVDIDENNFFSYCSQGLELGNKLTQSTWATYKIEYVISGMALDRGKDFQFRLQVKKAKLDAEPYKFQHIQKKETIREIGDELSTHIIGEWDRIIEKLSRGSQS